MGFYKDRGFLNDTITIFRKSPTAIATDYGTIYKWIGTVSKGLYSTEATIQFENTSKETKSTANFVIQEQLSLTIGAEERIILGDYQGDYTTLPSGARDIINAQDIRRISEIKSGVFASEWMVFVK